MQSEVPATAITESSIKTTEFLVFHGADVSTGSEKELLNMALLKKSSIEVFPTCLILQQAYPCLPGIFFPFDVVKETVGTEMFKN